MGEMRTIFDELCEELGGFPILNDRPINKPPKVIRDAIKKIQNRVIESVLEGGTVTDA